jgi:hypothetical protein
VLDLAVARLVIGQAAAQRSGTRVEGFFEGT